MVYMMTPGGEPGWFFNLILSSYLRVLFRCLEAYPLIFQLPKTRYNISVLKWTLFSKLIPALLSHGVFVSLSFLKIHNLSSYPDIQLHFETEEDDERELSFQLEGREKALLSALPGNKLFLCWRHQKTESANGPPLLFLVQESLMVNWAVVEKAPGRAGAASGRGDTRGH